MSFTWSNLLSSKLGLCMNGKFSHMSARYDFGFVYVVVQFYPWFKFYFPLFWGMVMYDNEF